MRLKSVPGDTTRPITDRVKESLFNIIAGDVRGAVFLDLFAGTGSVGIEALSRGAAFVRFNDRSKAANRTIRENLAVTRLGKNAEITQVDAFELLKKEADRVFDYVYIAPPQYLGLWSLALQLLDQNPGWLAEDAWVIVQIDPKEVAPIQLVHLSEFDRRKYGSTLLLFFSSPDY